MADRAETLLLHLRRLAFSPDSATDAELLRRFVRGRDEGAFAELVRRHGGLVLGVCRRVLRDAHRAEDAFQAVWLLLARKASTVRPAGNLPAWLHGVARQVALNALRGDVRRRKREAEAPAPRQVSPLDELTARELLLILDEELGRLPAVYRLPVISCCVEGLSQEEAARRLGWTPGSVKGRLERGRKLLHDRLMKRGLTLPAALALAEVSRGAAGVLAVLAVATVRAALAGAVSSGASALAGETLRGLLPARLKLVLVVLLVLGAGALGAGLLTPPPSEKDRPSEPPQAIENAGRKTQREPVRAGKDLYGDPLPPGVIARLGTARFRYEGEATALAFSPDGRVLAGSTGSGVILWDAATGKELRRLPVRTYLFSQSLDFAPDGATLAVGAAEVTKSGKEHLTIWDVASGKKLHTFTLPRSPFIQRSLGVRLSPDGKSLAVAGEGVGAYLLDLPSGRVRATADTTRGSIYGPTFSPDGKTVALGVLNPGVRICDAVTGKLVRGIDAHPKHFVGSVAYTRDGKVLASGSWDSIVLSDPETGNELGRLEAKMQSVNGLAFTPDGQTLVSGSQDGKLRVWDVATCKARLTLDGRMGIGRCMALTRDGKTVAIGTVGQAVRLWDVATGKELFTRFGGHDSQVYSLAFAPDGKALFTGGDTRQIRIWDTASWEQSRLLPGGAHTLSVSPDGKRLAAVPSGKAMHLWDVGTSREALVIAVPDTDSVRFALFSADGKTIVTADEKRITDKTGYTSGFITRLRRWEAATGKLLGEFALPADATDAPAVAPDGKTAFVGGMWGSVYAIDLEAGRVRYQTEKRDSRFRGFTASADGGLLLSVDLSNDVNVWEVASGKMALTFRGHRRTPGAVALSPDGRVVASADVNYFQTDVERSRSVRLWDLATGKELATFEGYGADVTSLAFSPDGSVLAAGLSGSTALVWDVAKLTRTSRPKGKRLDTEGLQALWADLAGDDAAKAYRAVWALADAPGQAVPFLRKRLRPVPTADPEQLRRWLADLDSKEFAVPIARGQEALSRLGGQAEQAVTLALKGSPSLEVRRRLEAVLKVVEGVPDSETLRTLRAIRALERIGSAAARSALENLAGGALAARETREARLAWERLAKRPAAAP